MKRSLFKVMAISLTLLITFGVFSSTLTTTTAQDNDRSAEPDGFQPERTFTNSTPFSISDGVAAPSTPPFTAVTVSGLTGTIPATAGSVRVTLNNFSHTFPDDLGMMLVGPTGAAFEFLSGPTSDGGGQPASNLNITVSDSGAAALPDNAALASTTYKPAAYYDDIGFWPTPPGNVFVAPAPAGTATFSSVFAGTNPNGEWKLYITDFADGDGGSITGGWTLEIIMGPPGDAPVDMTGDGKTDFVVVRPAVPLVPDAQLLWYVLNNGGGGGSTTYWGLSGDSVVPGDFDGDDHDDIAIWRPATEATFCALLSQTQTVRCEQFGQTGDDPSVIGDYNNDGKDDIAVYREGALEGQQSFWHYRTAPGPGGITTIVWGSGGDFPAPGDYDGDGRYDFVVQRANVGGSATFWKLTAAGAVSAETFGFSSDLIAPGDYDGDDKTDLCVLRAGSGQILWLYEPSGTAGSTVSGGAWGLADGNDFPVQGDYDGDKRTDFAIWRPQTAPASSTFWVLQSSNLQPLIQPWGAEDDYPVANYNVR